MSVRTSSGLKHTSLVLACEIWIEDCQHDIKDIQHMTTLMLDIEPDSSDQVVCAAHHHAEDRVVASSRMSRAESRKTLSIRLGLSCSRAATLPRQAQQSAF